jgi:mannitol operon transcriptional antiterminator
MFITSREKAIIELIIKTSAKHTALSIATFLNVSVRTIQRDLKATEKVLQQFDLQLTRNTNDGLTIEGKNEQIFRLIQHLMESHPIDQTPKERKLLLLLTLLNEESYKIQTLAIQLGVSITTLNTYLDELTDWLKNLNVQLSRRRGVGLQLHGTEANKRKALANYLLLYFNEELIESLFLLEKGEFSQERILHYFIPYYVLVIDQVVNATFNSTQSQLTDSDYIGLIIHICIILQRTEAHFVQEEIGSEQDKELTEEHDLIVKICMELESKIPVTFTKEDINYLAIILKGSKIQAADAVPYDSVMLGQMVKNLIQYVSSQLNVDLTKDFSLFQGLLAHMEPSLFRIKQQMGLFNPLKEEIKRKYPVLFMAVKNSVEKEFKDIADFPEDEIAFLVLHFGSSLVMREEVISIKAVVVCPTGIGTSKMLASRVKKEIIEIDLVEIKSIKQIQQQESLNQYDVILSTVRLPFIDMEYILVNPLLSEENIVTIRRFLRTNIENFTKNNHYLKTIPQEIPASVMKKTTLTDVMEQLKDTQQSIEAIIKNFRVYRMPQMKNHELILVKMVETAEQENLLTHAGAVLESLEERERKGGLGIPNTGMALFHSRHASVRELIFQVAHLNEPCLVKGMDGNEMLIKNLLLMLAPEKLSTIEQEIISLVSTSLIENNEAIMIFSSSNEEMIRTKLESIFLDYLHTNLIRE